VRGCGVVDYYELHIAIGESSNGGGGGGGSEHEYVDEEEGHDFEPEPEELGPEPLSNPTEEEEQFRVFVHVF
jgi:hypothetical protein